jgi:hypothetical protein
MRILRRRRSSAREEVATGGDRLIDEIRHLTEQNRVHRDTKVERRLVELRYEVFKVLDVPSSPPEWPDDIDDLYEGQLVPEIDRNDLTVEAIRSGINNHGSLLVRGLLGSDAVAQLKDGIDKSFDAFDARANGDMQSEVEGWYEPVTHRMITDDDRARKRSRGNILAFESPPVLFDLIEIMNSAGIGDLANLHFGEVPGILARKVTLRRMEHNFGGAWHQDGAFMGSGIRSLNIWIALSHCGDNAPGLDVAGRRFDELLPTGKGASKVWGIKPEDAEAAAGDTIVRPIFEAGDALIFDHMCLHKTGIEKSMTERRYAIEMWYFAPSTYAEMSKHVDGGYSPRDQVPLYY